MFKLIERNDLNEINSEGFLYEHESGAKLILLKNGDENKVFSVTFKTMPYDDSGVFHILEHSVLCGSENYECKDPFNELAKGSLYSYLNAMTFQDKTMFPVASLNQGEFFNMMGVYLDAVFKPLLREEVFWQEGWRYEKTGDNLSVGGIVYNEMKGAFSDFDKQIDYELRRNLFPGSPYSFASGGHPREISSLTYEKFLRAYEEYYNPSNCTIYLYGDFDTQKAMKLIESYLNPKNEKNKDANAAKAYAAAFVTGNYGQFEQMEGLRILRRILLSTQASPLKNILLTLGEDVESSFDDDIYSPILKIVLKNPSVSLGEFETKLNQALLTIAEEGIDEGLILAALNQAEFKYTEEDYGYKPRGLAYNIEMVRNIIHGEQVFAGLNKLDILKNIRSKYKERYFESLIESLLIQNKHKLCMSIREELIEEDKIYLGLQEKLNQYQSAQDSTITKIPHIKISDICKTVKTGREEKLSERILFIHTSSDLLYSELIFDTSNVSGANLPYIGFLTYLLAKLSTKNRSYQELSSALQVSAGCFSIYFTVYDEALTFKPAICIRINSLENQYQTVLTLAEDILNNTLFEDKERIKMLLTSWKLKLQKDFILNAQYYSASRAKSYVSGAEKYKQEAAGLSMYLFLNKTLERFESGWDEIRESLYTVKKQIFSKQNLFIAVNKTTVSYSDFIGALGDGEKTAKISIQENSLYPEAFITSSAVMSNAKVVKSKNAMLSFAHMQVLKTILDSEYLMKKIRIVGGAYGCHFSISRQGHAVFYSFRDPQMMKTLEIYDGATKYLDTFSPAGNEMELYVIGTINRLDKPKHEKKLFMESIQKYFLGLDTAALQSEREEILACSIADIKRAAFALSDISEEKSVAVLGNAEIIKQDRGYFKKITML